MRKIKTICAVVFAIISSIPEVVFGSFWTGKGLKRRMRKGIVHKNGKTPVFIYKGKGRLMVLIIVLYFLVAYLLGKLCNDADHFFFVEHFITILQKGFFLRKFLANQGSYHRSWLKLMLMYKYFLVRSHCLPCR